MSSLTAASAIIDESGVHSETHDNEYLYSEEEEERFLKELHDVPWTIYAFQKDINPTGYFGSFRGFYDSHDKAGGPIIQAMDLRGAKHFSLSELERITNSFSKKNLITPSAYGRLFHGVIDQKNVLVKTWDLKWPPCPPRSELSLWRISEELRCLRRHGIRNHPNVVKLIGFHCDRRLAVIYEGSSPKHVLTDIITSDDFEWQDRLKVAIEIASVVKTFHDNDLVHGGVRDYCFMVYEDYSVVSFEFNVDFHGTDVRRVYKDDLVYDRDLNRPNELPPMTMQSEDVFVYGSLLLMLATKNDALYKVAKYWLRDEVRGDLVHESLKVDEESKSVFMDLVNNCLKIKLGESHLQPKMGDAIEILKKLLQRNAAAPMVKRQKTTCHPIQH